MTSPQRPSSVRPVEYKGEPLDAERGPGLGCFWVQLTLLIVSIVLTPLTVMWNMPSWVSISLLFITIILLLFSGQTVIFLLRLVASDRRDGRRVPLAGTSPTVGELEDEIPAEAVADEQGSGHARDVAPVEADGLAAGEASEPAVTEGGEPAAMDGGAVEDGPAPDGVRE